MAKIKFRKIAVAALSAVGLSSIAFGVSGCLPKSTDLTEPDNIEITRTAPPDDGSLPTAHTCAENLAYIIHVFDNQPQYHTYSYGVTSASIATQTTRNFRDYKDGILLNTDLTYSSMVKGGTQTCSMYNAEGEYEVYFRTSEAPEADTLPSQAVWSEDAPTFFNEKAYHFTYGLLPNELFNYIVNEQNIIDSEQIKVNSDGTYTQSFTLDPVASTYYYQFGMKTRGGLSGYPDFESITFSVTFDEQWQILSAKMHEVAKVNKGIVVPSVSDFNTQYWYGDDHFDEEHYSYYENYFKKYLGNDDLEQGGSNDEGLTIDVTNVLSNGFSQIMNGGAQFGLSVNLGANRYVGYAFVSLDLSDPLGTLALKVSLGKSLKEQTLYIEYGNDGLAAYYGKDFALSANLSEVKLAIGGFGEIIDKIKAAFTVPEETAPAEGGESAEGGEPAALSESDPVTELMNAMTLTAGEKQAVLTLDTDDLLGLGIGINAKLVFGINDNKITFRSGVVGGLSIGGEKVDLGVNIATTTAPEINRVPSETGANLAEYIADVHSLLGAELIKATVTLNGDGENVSIGALKGLYANVTAYADIDGVTVGADADVSYTYKGQKVTAKAGVWYCYDAAQKNYGKAVVSLTELNGARVDLKVKCDIKEVADALSTLVTFGGGDGGIATEELVNIVNGALSSDFSSLLTELYADKAQIKVGVSVDALLDMLSVKTGIKFGSCTLRYSRGDGEGVYGGELSAALPALGLNLAICGEGGRLDMPDDSDCLDLKYVIDDIKEIANAELIKAHIGLDGAAEGVTIKELNGVTAGIDVYFNPESVAVAADLDIAYTYGESKVSASLSVWYEKGESGLGKIVLSLNSINGKPLSAKVYCDITEIKDAVTALLDYANIKIAPFEKGGEGDTPDIISKILGADFNKLLPVLGTDANGLTVALNVDGVLSLFDIDAGISLGNLSLAYDRAAESKLSGKAPALGLTAEVCGTSGTIKAMPDPADCLDLTKLVKTVHAAWEQVDGIIENQSISFSIVRGETYLSLDGIVVEIWGEGEVCWKKGSEYVALDLAFSITGTDGDGKALQPDVTEFKFIYDKNAETTPFIRLALNKIGIDIYKDDIENVKQDFNDIYNKVMSIFGKKTEEGQPDGGTAVAAVDEITEGDVDTAPAQSDKLMGVIFGLLASDGWVDFLNDLTLTSDGKSVTLSYLTKNSVDIGVGEDGGLFLYYDGAFGERFALSGGIEASATLGNLCDGIALKLNDCKMSSSKTLGASFIKNVYDFLFNSISGISVENILGSKTYTVAFELNGNNTNIAELKDIFVNAELYFTGAGAGKDLDRVAEGNLDIDAAGVVIKLHVITERTATDTRFFINLKQVMDVKLPDLKFLATQSSLYETFDVLLSAVNNTDLLSVIGKFTESGESGEAKADEGVPAAQNGGGGENLIPESTADKIADLLTKLLNFSFKDVVYGVGYVDEDGAVKNDILTKDDITHAFIDLDGIVGQLGITSGKLGTVEVEINHKTHAMTTYGTTDIAGADGKTERRRWISLSSKLAEERRNYDELGFKRSDYISIEFLPDLIGDLVKTATDDNGNLYDKFTFSGRISATLTLLKEFNLNINVKALTVGIPEDGGLYISGILNIEKCDIKLLGIGMTIPNRTVGITYKNGVLTLAKNIESKPEYRVMTFDYFMDHLLSSDDSCIQWLLDVENWNMLPTILKLAGVSDIPSGSNTGDNVYLYKPARSYNPQTISMGDYVDAISIVLGDKVTQYIGSSKNNTYSQSSFESTLGIAGSDYYGFALNPGFTGGILTKLFAAITRGEGGITGIKANGGISYSPITVSFSANLNYNKGVTDEYVIGGALSGETSAAPDMYAAATAIAEEELGKGEVGKYFGKEAVIYQSYTEYAGCIKVVPSGETYAVTKEDTHALASYELNIMVKQADASGAYTGEYVLGETRTVKDTSVIYLYDDNSPLYADSTEKVRVLYSATPDEIGGQTVTVNGGNLTVYAVYKKAVDAVILNRGDGKQVARVYLYEGQPLPAEVDADGLTQFGKLTYADGSEASGTVDGSVRQIELYGTFVKTEEEIKGVKYTFVPDDNGGHYIASGKGAGFDIYTGDDAQTLEISGYINGLPVTEIADSAFANTDGKPLKSVVVPETVTKIGAAAFLDNYGLQSVVILGGSVTVGGASDKNNNSDKDQPFYGCSAVKDGTSTNIVIYYNEIVCGGSSTNMIWTKFRVNTSGLSTYRNYIGQTPSNENTYAKNGGGTLYKNGEWQYAEYSVNVDESAVAGGKLKKASVEKTLAPFFPVCVAGTFANSSVATAAEQALVNSFGDYEFEDGNLIYTCKYSVEYKVIGCKVTAVYNVSYVTAERVTVTSSIECKYNGALIAANSSIVVYKAVGEQLTDAISMSPLYWFVDWSYENGVYTANWHERQSYTVTVNVNKGWSDRNNLYLNGTKVSSISFTVLEGNVTVGVQNKVLIVNDGVTEYRVEVKEINWLSQESGSRDIKCDATTIEQSGTLTIYY